MDVVGRSANQYFQRKKSEEKAGYYPTEQQHCRWIREHLLFPEEEVSVLEPSAGDGTAVKLVTGSEENSNIKLFAVEINADFCKKMQDDGGFEAVLNGDFRNDVFITNNAFSFCFGNPPYMEELNFEKSYGLKAERQEKVFLDKCTKYLRTGAIMVWVIPHRVFIEDTYCSFWMSRYETLKVYKFHKSEFEKWGQIVLFGKKRPNILGIMKEDRKAMQARCQLELLDELPMVVNEDEKIQVPPSAASLVANFRAREFDPAAASDFLNKNPNANLQLRKAIASKTGVKAYENTRIYRPLIPLKKAQSALMAACGVSSGFAGSVEEGNLHLQRGSVEQSIEETTDLSNGTVTVVKKNITNIVLIEANGKITDLVKQDGVDKLDNLEEEDSAS